MVYKMKKEILDKIAPLNFWNKEQDTGFPRKELLEVKRFSDDLKTALIIAGIRRSGKTYLAKQILKDKLKIVSPEQTLIINFEEPALEPYLNTDSLQEIYETYRYYLNKDKPAYIVLDEIHNVPKWEKWVRIMLEKNEKVKFIITGSSSKIFKGELANVLSGRTIHFILFPLSFQNFLEFKEYSLKKYQSFQQLEPFLQEYIEYGSFPLITLVQEKSIYLQQLFDDIVLKDIVIKYKLRELEIRKLAVLLMNYTSSLVSVNRLKQTVMEVAKTSLSPTSINSYLYYFEEAFLFFFIPIFSYKIKEQMQYPRKAYCLDTGLINAITLRFSDNIGRLYENKVAINLIQIYGKENVFYGKQANELEVDFVIKEKTKVKQLIQVCYKLNANSRQREIKALLKALEEFKLNEGLVITENEESKETIAGKTIYYTPLWKWLLE